MTPVQKFELCRDLEAKVRSADIIRQERIKALLDAHKIINKAFDQQLSLWIYIPIIGPIIGTVIVGRRNKLISVGAYIVNQVSAIRREAEDEQRSVFSELISMNGEEA